MKLEFKWDLAKEKINQRKHDVSFEEAKTVFLDDEALLIPDPDHSVAEERFVLLGMSQKGESYWFAIVTGETTK